MASLNGYGDYRMLGNDDAFREYRKAMNYVKRIADVVEETYLYEVYLTKNGEHYIINWKGTVRPNMSLQAAVEWAEDAQAVFEGIPEEWYQQMKSVYERYGNDSSRVTHIGFSRGGGIAAFFGGISYGGLLTPSLKVKDGAQILGAKDFIHKWLHKLTPKHYNTRRNPA